MYKVGDEVSVKGEITKVCESGVVVKAHYFGEAYFDRSNMDLIGKTYEQGLSDAWELAKKILNMKLDVAVEVFDCTRIFDVMDKFNPEEALAKIEAYEKSNAIILGDEVVHDCDGCKTKFYVTYLTKNQIKGFDKDGDTHYFTLPNRYIKKTGKHIDIESLLRQIGE